MPFELRYATLAATNLPQVRPEVVAAIDAGLSRLADDPVALSRPSVCPPFPPFGHQFDIPCKDNSGRRYNCVVFFLYSDCGKYLDIHRMQIQSIGARPEQHREQPVEIPAEYREFTIPDNKSTT